MMGRCSDIPALPLPVVAQTIASRRPMRLHEIVDDPADAANLTPRQGHRFVGAYGQQSEQLLDAVLRGVPGQRRGAPGRVDPQA